ncbi:phosphoenolpyruvate synthase [Caerostris darwini]|uniref:Phosphoenolpyruvate synthase n=1 Tax=Caerostris darwini TaxID=1538125 RepID=A0AAV4W800_9ARAC|nr:phosphoenolpyruvate synthase [Caerostris darwini]
MKDNKVPQQKACEDTKQMSAAGQMDTYLGVSLDEVSVVSGSEEPDTIDIERQEDGTLAIKDIIIGSKSHRIILKDEGGTVVEDVSDHKKQLCCLNDTMALRLAQLAVKLERSFGSHRDIEWGFWNNNLYIFQSRPVTSGSEETDFEIDHEFDAGLRCENDYFTMCNVGPQGALLQSIRETMVTRKKGLPFPTHKRGCISNPATSVGLFGRIIEDEELFEIARERFANSQLKKDSSFEESLRRMYRVLFGFKRYLNRTIKNYAGYHVNDDKCVDSRQLYDRLLCSCTELTPVMVAHMFCSEGSSLLNMIIFITLQKATGGKKKKL